MGRGGGLARLGGADDECRVRSVSEECGTVAGYRNLLCCTCKREETHGKILFSLAYSGLRCVNNSPGCRKVGSCSVAVWSSTEALESGCWIRAQRALLAACTFGALPAPTHEQEARPPLLLLLSCLLATSCLMPHASCAACAALRLCIEHRPLSSVSVAGA